VLGWVRRLLGRGRQPAKADLRDANGRTSAGKLDADQIEAARQRLKESIPPPPDPEA
jgi:hypothetical protein